MVGIWALPLRAGELQASLDARSCGLLCTLRIPNPRLSLLGHVVTRFDRRLVVHRSYEQKLREIHGDLVLRTVIPEVSAFKVSLACRRPVGIYSPRTSAACLTSELGREILDHIDAAKGYSKEAVTA